MRGRILKSDDGATLPFVALILVVLLGLIGLGYDFGRQFVMRSELQKAADAAAVAGGYQLDLAADQSAVQNRVMEAVNGAAITANETRFANLPGDVQIANVRLLQSIPADDDDPIDSSHVGPPYGYVEVTTAISAQDFSFLRLFGQGTMNATATAVAGRGRAVCQIAPMAICNPEEAVSGPGAGFDPSDYIGRQILAKAKGAGSAWAPGDFGYLAFPGATGANELANTLANRNGANACFGAEVTTEPGQMTRLRTAFNTRFDIYENPGYGGSARTDPQFAPAQNVVKGYDTNFPNRCNQVPSTAANIMAMPRDADISQANRFGNGQWDCEAYWNVNHPSDPMPAGCGAPGATSMTRFEVYLHEIQNGIIPDNSATNGENGDPACSTETPVQSSFNPAEYRLDRRVITMAVLNCVDQGISGRARDVPTLAYITAFITEPVAEAPNDDVYLEVIGSSIQGNGGIAPVAVRDWVEVIR